MAITKYNPNMLYGSLKDTNESDEIDKEEKGEGDFAKKSIDDLDLSVRTSKVLSNAGVRTVAGLVLKSEEDLLNLEGLGEKGVQEIKDVLSSNEMSLKEKK